MERHRLDLGALERYCDHNAFMWKRQASWNEASLVWLVLLSAAVVALWIFK